MRRIRGTFLALVAASIAATGCFQPPLAQPPPASQNRAMIGAPYDLTWEAIHKVIKKNDYRVQANDPDHGIVEAEAVHFSLNDADCGQIQSVVGTYSQEPDPSATAVYSFKVEPSGANASVVAVNATFTAPLHVPLHQLRDFQCVSRGTAEARLLKEIQAQAKAEHRPPVTKPVNPAVSGAPELPSVPKLAPLTPGRPTLLRPELSEPKIQ